jgi:putative sigma-54 modulation protein
MNISITFRQMDPSEAIKKYATNKIARLQKLLEQPMVAKVTFAIQKQRHITEVQIASGSRRVEARESSDEMYAAIDEVMDKLERQISGGKAERVTKTRRSRAVVAKVRAAAEKKGDGAAVAAPAPKSKKKAASKKVASRARSKA